MFRAILRATVYLTALVLLTACSGDDPEAAYRTYLERLGRTLDVDVTAVRPPDFPRPPRPGALRLPITSDSLDTLDFLSLSGCAVQVTIGKRNSSLGRMAAPSQRLLLALEYLRLAPECVETLRADGKDSLADTLENAQRLKRDQLPALIFNATLGSDEYRAFWQASSTPGGFPPVDPATAENALSAINGYTRRWLAGDYTADNQAFEILLAEVAGGGGGRLLNRLLVQAAWLDAANAMLGTRLARGPLCAPGTRHAAADILPKVVEKFFVGEIQPAAAILHRQTYQVLPPAQELEALLSNVLPEPFRAWQAERDNRLEHSRSAPRRHVEQVQAIQSPCN